MQTPLRIGAVGLGRLGRFHAETVARRLADAHLAAVCSVTPDDLSWAKKAFPEAARFSSYEDMLSLEPLDAVVISSPSALHCTQVVQALQAGCHVFCEKPLGTTVEDCERVVKACESQPNLHVMLGFMRRFDPSYLDVHRRIQAGEIGRPILFRGYSVDPASTIESALAYLPHSSGQFLDMAVHDIDLARWLLQSEPQMVMAAGGCYAHPEFADFGDGDQVAAFLQFKNQAMAFLLAGRLAAHGYQVESEIIGTEGTLRVGATPQKNFVEILDRNGVRKECSQHFLERFHAAYVAELEAFTYGIRQDEPPTPSVKDGLLATAIALDAQCSFQEGRLVPCQ